MPCSDSLVDVDELVREHRRLADEELLDLIGYVRRRGKSLGIEMQKFPHLQSLSFNRDGAVRDLCAICKKLEKDGEEQLITEHPGLERWWAQHQIDDQRRLESLRGKVQHYRERLRQAEEELAAEED